MKYIRPMSSFKLKILLVGSLGKEKTELIHKFTKNRFRYDYKLTIGVDISTKEVEFKPNETATLSIWDIGIQKRFEFIRGTFYKGATGVIVIFSVNRKQTLLEAAKWISEIRKLSGEKVQIALIGLKTELNKEKEDFIVNGEIQEFVKSENIGYVKTEKKTEINIEKAFTELTNLIIATRTI
jgi:small GTP-binding protein